MKIKINNYTFNKTNKTILFKDFDIIDLSSILAITNTTDNICIYDFQSPALGGTVSGNLLTLDYDTSLMDDTDALQIFYDDINSSVASSSDIDRVITAINAEDKDVCIDMVLDAKVATAAPGIQLIGITDSVGNPITETGGSLNANITNIVTVAQNTKFFQYLRTRVAGGYILPITDVTGFKSAMVELDGTWAGTVAFQGSNNLASWFPLPANVMNVATVGLVINTTVVGSYEVPLKVKYFRVICTAYTSGLIQGSVTLDAVGSATNNPTIGSVIALADGQTARETVPNAINNAGAVGPLDVLLKTYNGTTLDTNRSVLAGTNSVGTGIQAVGNLAQLDDILPTPITEDKFGNVRMTAKRGMHTAIRSSDGNDFGVAVSGAGEIMNHSQRTEDVLIEIRNQLDTLNNQVINLPTQSPKLESRWNRIITVPVNSRENIKTVYTVISNTTNETVISTGVSKLNDYLDLVALVITNSSASTSSVVDFRDTVGGAIKFSIQSIGGQLPIVLSFGGVTIPQSAQGSMWTAQCGTGVTDLKIMAIYSIN